MASIQRWVTTAALVAALPLTLAADTLYLRNGTRIDGELVEIRGNTVQFRDQRSGSRVIRVNRGDVDRIDFGRFGGGSSGGNNWIGGGRPSGLRERQINVAATQPWNDTGVDLRAGQTIYVDARGEVRWGRDRRDGPQGEKNSPFNQGRPLPNRPGGALIGRIGNDLFFIGAETGAIRVRAGGRLLLGVNDDYLQDNAGSFRVTVFY